METRKRNDSINQEINQQVMVRSNPPEYINYCHSIQEFKEGKIIKIPIDIMKKNIALSRKLPEGIEFNWIEDFVNNPIHSHVDETIKIIDPNKIIVTYDKSVGYFLLAGDTIEQGECLIFTGEEYTKLKKDDASNAYLTFYNTNDVNHYINAKATGGFASLMLNLPPEGTYSNQKHWPKLTDEYATQNFVGKVIPNKKNKNHQFILYQAVRTILKGEVLGSYYLLNLLFDKYCGFTRFSGPFANDLQYKINKKMFNEARYIFFDSLNFFYKVEIKIINNFKKNKIEKGLESIVNVFYLFPFPLLQENELLEILKHQQELEQVIKKSPLEEKYKPNLNQIVIKIESVLLKRKKQSSIDKSLFHRDALEQIWDFYTKQIEHIKDGRICIYNEEYDRKRFVLYPGILEDCQRIAKTFGLAGDYSGEIKFLSYGSFFAKKMIKSEFNYAFMQLKAAYKKDNMQYGVICKDNKNIYHLIHVKKSGENTTRPQYNIVNLNKALINVSNYNDISEDTLHEFVLKTFPQVKLLEVDTKANTTLSVNPLKRES